MDNYNRAEIPTLTHLTPPNKLLCFITVMLSIPITQTHKGTWTQDELWNRREPKLCMMFIML